MVRNEGSREGWKEEPQIPGSCKSKFFAAGSVWRVQLSLENKETQSRRGEEGGKEATAAEGLAWLSQP